MAWNFDLSPSPTAGASAQLRTSSGASRSIPAPAPVQSSTPPSVQRSSSGGGSSSSGMQIGGWYNGRQGDGSRLGNPGEVIVGNSGGGGGQSSGENQDDEYNRLIDQMFNEAIAVTDKRKGDAQADYDSAVKTTNSQYELALNQARENAAQVAKQGSLKKDEYGRVLNDSLNSASRNYNVLQQNVSSRFGRGSSAGAAASELVGQEYARGEQGLRQTYMSKMGELEIEQEKITLAKAHFEQDLEMRKQTALDSISKELRDTMARIEAQKAQLGMDKSSMRINALMDARRRAEEITLNANIRAQQFKEAIALKQIEINGQYDQANRYINAFDAQSDYSNYTESDYSGSTLLPQNQVAPTTRLRNTAYQQEDEMDEYTSPFYSKASSASRSF